jgi:hypothetical protein
MLWIEGAAWWQAKAGAVGEDAGVGRLPGQRHEASPFTSRRTLADFGVGNSPPMQQSMKLVTDEGHRPPSCLHVRR